MSAPLSSTRSRLARTDFRAFVALNAGLDVTTPDPVRRECLNAVLDGVDARLEGGARELCAALPPASFTGSSPCS